MQPVEEQAFIATLHLNELLARVLSDPATAQRSLSITLESGRSGRLMIDDEAHTLDVTPESTASEAGNPECRCFLQLRDGLHCVGLSSCAVRVVGNLDSHRSLIKERTDEAAKEKEQHRATVETDASLLKRSSSARGDGAAGHAKRVAVDPSHSHTYSAPPSRMHQAIREFLQAHPASSFGEIRRSLNVGGDATGEIYSVLRQIAVNNAGHYTLLPAASSSAAAVASASPAAGSASRKTTSSASGASSNVQAGATARSSAAAGSLRQPSDGFASNVLAELSQPPPRLPTSPISTAVEATSRRMDFEQRFVLYRKLHDLVTSQGAYVEELNARIGASDGAAERAELTARIERESAERAPIIEAATKLYTRLHDELRRTKEELRRWDRGNASQ